MTRTNDPNQQLGTEIFEALAEKGLVDAEESKGLLKQLVEGSVKGSDWKLAFETAIRTSLNASTDEVDQPGN